MGSQKAQPVMATEHTGQVLESFDNIAGIFDEEFENEITRSLRQKLYSAIGSLVPPGSSILDINCGTGIDAIALSRKGYSVAGVDLSPRMIERAQRKSSEHGLPVRFMVSSFECLDKIAWEPFDLVLSNFGGLNCAGRLDKVAEQTAAVIKPGGFLIGVVMPPVCLWEILDGSRRFHFRTAFRRLRKNVLATGFRGKTFSVHYHSPGRFTKAFKRWFEVREIRGLNILSPPPHAAVLARRYPAISSILESIDERIAYLPACRSIGDHFMATLKRR